jgi:3-oxoacyl-[acyl-carrier protein] reductase
LTPLSAESIDRVAVVTGGGSGIGSAISRRFLSEGIRVIICHESQELADELAERLGAAPGAVIAVGADLVTAEGCHKVVARSIETFGRIDILVNNAAVTGRPALASFIDSTDEHLDLVIDLNLKGVFRCSREAARFMCRAGSGVIVNVASVAAFAAQQNAAAYAASKAGVVGLTRSLGFELAPRGVRVVAVAPGDIDVGPRAWTMHGESDSDSGWWTRTIPVGRRGVPADIAGVVSFLCSQDASYLTGQTITVDGGLLTY